MTSQTRRWISSRKDVCYEIPGTEIAYKKGTNKLSNWKGFCLTNKVHNAVQRVEDSWIYPSARPPADNEEYIPIDPVLLSQADRLANMITGTRGEPLSDTTEDDVWDHLLGPDSPSCCQQKQHKQQQNSNNS